MGGTGSSVEGQGEGGGKGLREVRRDGERWRVIAVKRDREWWEGTGSGVEGQGEGGGQGPGEVGRDRRW